MDSRQLSLMDSSSLRIDWFGPLVPHGEREPRDTAQAATLMQPQIMHLLLVQF